ncbi:hypothetical protein M673_18425 (plasmid) [Aureimonas sp. AU20]|uniref:NAD-dependent epimerase/dehydratase family protein n=1 Tax=Aureimonas sp. AU20 TaxID=1349819 RepID=UPI00071ED2A8|nr:NAD-dependent epimerase/dehydratase family protein [Aureimonas sp. AU20]ALN74698.1 hypothetical protein M673_18425 [Aureimonas sp. AU20]
MNAPHETAIGPAPGALAALRGRRVLVTGGAGFIGSHVVDLLVEAGARVTIIDDLVRGSVANLGRALPSGRVRFVEGDIRDRPLMAELVGEAEIVFHMAALRITQCAAEPRRALEVMVDASFDLFEACAARGVSRVVYSSSASVYGLADRFPTPEAAGGWDNRTLYGAAKAFGEGMLRACQDLHDLKHVSLRYFNVYGPRMDVHGRYTEVLIRWMERIDAGLPPVIFGDGRQTMDFVHVEDVARANILAAVAPVTDRAFNIGSGRETSLLDLARSLCAVMGRPDLTPLHEAERGVNPVPRRLADVAMAREHLRFEARIPLEAGLAGLVAWWREQEVLLQGAAQ